MKREAEIRYEAETKLHKMLMAHIAAEDINLHAMLYEMFDIIWEVINIYDNEVVIQSKDRRK